MDYLIIIISLIFSAFFSGIEIAFVSANKLEIALDKEKNTFSCSVVFRFLNNQSNLITSMLIGNNIALVIYGIFMAKVCSQPFEQFLIEYFNFSQGNSLYFFVGLLEILFSSMIFEKFFFNASLPDDPIMSPRTKIFIYKMPFSVII